ncbi:hypothetical protein CXZ10_19920 [Pleomorphomonas diazotrophica]|uniref:Gluconokinase n=1 Tax=Pleomorphomonas diazotrophica TaxID=1166257 RepID=A0A1I4WTC9_9HYPH|nr:gluconokinase, GntK/IdnK-type [Pleomorphomonas diazotrophica]PKR87320.1 hypothetical protein CXZ10_19920 [Pleomorphomonas diazotrophica]SFN16239.1 gluconate kinase, SKI family [Pleomorphomonas diazotrophica]
MAAPVAIRSDCILVMGVCGAGKSTVAARLAAALGGRLIEADDHHPEDNVRSMSEGKPLTDEQRWPWLAAVAEAAADARRQVSGPVVIACSALKRRYRDRLRDRLGPIAILHLAGPAALLRQRLEARRGHFMPPALLDSQFAALEPPGADEQAITLLVELGPDDIVACALAALGAPARPIPEPARAATP